MKLSAILLQHGATSGVRSDRGIADELSTVAGLTGNLVKLSFVLERPTEVQGTDPFPEIGQSRVTKATGVLALQLSTNELKLSPNGVLTSVGLAALKSPDTVAAIIKFSPDIDLPAILLKAHELSRPASQKDPISLKDASFT